MSNPASSVRTRSPRFPGHSVNDAIEFARRIYDGAHTSQIDSLTAIKLMNFSGKSGASATALGSVRQFGLIEGVGEKTRISNLALKILEPESPTERMEALREAAKQPEVFRQVYDRFDARIPAANEPIRAYLIRELGFSKSGAEDCLRSLRETIEQSDLNRSESSDSLPAEIPDRVLAQNDRIDFSANPPSDPLAELIKIPLTRECSAELRLSGTVSEKALNNLIRHIELMKEVWVED